MAVDWMMFSLHVGVLLGMAGVAAYCMTVPQEVEVAAPPKEEPPKFSDLYPLQASKIETEPETETETETEREETPLEPEANLELRQVEDDVPDSGRVVLRSCNVPGEFEYWADRAVSYPNLEALARKWALVYKAPEVYLVRKRVTETVAPPVPTLEDTVFATLKTYTPSPSVVVKKEQANSFRWRGKMREVPAKKKEVAVVPTLRYSDYKKNV